MGVCQADKDIIIDNAMDSDYRARRQVETLANAQLIAAAPELLFALQNLMKGIEGLSPLTAIAGMNGKEYKQAEKANKTLGYESTKRPGT